MKKILALILVVVLALGAFASCSAPEDTSSISVGYMAGPTGIGMAKLIHDNGGVDGNEKYSAFTKFTASELAVTALLSGTIDIACLPTNDAAKYYNLEDDSIRVLAINCLNSLSLVAKNGVAIDSIEDLEGKTIYTCEKGTPHSILNALLDAYDVNATVAYSIGDTALVTPDSLAPVMKKGLADIVLAPTHLVAAADSNGNYSKALDIDALWGEKFDTPIAMGCVVTTEAFINEHPQLVSKFLNEYKASIEFVSNSENVDLSAKYVVDATILGAEPVAKKAILNLGDGISYVDGSEMKNVLIGIYGIFDGIDIGNELPDNDFYYEN